MRPIRTICDQLRWDPRSDPAAFTVGFESRAEAPVEVTLPEFLADPEVPDHRVRYVRLGPERVWDRAARLDRVRAVLSAR